MLMSVSRARIVHGHEAGLYACAGKMLDDRMSMNVADIDRERLVNRSSPAPQLSPRWKGSPRPTGASLRQ
jgi:hypothetical protein